MSYDAIYRAKATGRHGSSLDVFVPQVFGDTPIKVTESVGGKVPGMGWVMFQGGDPAHPVWFPDIGLSSGGGDGTGSDEVYVGNEDPGMSYEMWFDPDAVTPGMVDEVWIGTAEPTAPTAELWFDTDAVPSVPGGLVPPGGTTNQVLAKTTNADYATGWAPAVLPGGTTGQLLSKASNADGAVQWSALVLPTPAQAGARADIATTARFGHVSLNGRVGWMANNTGSLDAIAADNTPLSFWRLDAAGTGFVHLGVFDTGGRLLVGKQSSDGGAPGAELHPTGGLVNVVGDGSGSSSNQYLNHVQSRDSNGSMYLNLSRSGSNINIGSITQVNTTGVAYNTSSDYRLKDEIGPVPDALARLLDLRPIRFSWKENGVETDGFLAHEVQEIIPEAATGTKDEEDAEGNPVYQGIDQAKIVPLLVAAVQELTAQVAELQAQIAALGA